MTTSSVSPHAFVLSARQGRTREPLGVHGMELLVKLASADTDDAAAIFHLTIPPMSGPPLHRHSREDEWFYVLHGEITAELEGQRILLRAGDCFFAPRGAAHAFQNFGNAAAQMLVMVTPGQLVRLFEELSAWNKRLPAPDPRRLEELADEYGVEILGPPLARAAVERGSRR
jgi:quercetin dioxygenase-like cupin family protein